MARTDQVWRAAKVRERRSARQLARQLAGLLSGVDYSIDALAREAKRHAHQRRARVWR